MSLHLLNGDLLVLMGLGLTLILLFPPLWDRLPEKLGVRLSSNTRWVLAGFSFSLLLLLYPPFWHGSQYGSGTRRWHFVLAGHQGHLDMSMLFLEFFVAGGGLGAAWYVSTSLRDKEAQ